MSVYNQSIVRRNIAYWRNILDSVTISDYFQISTEYGSLSFDIDFDNGRYIFRVVYKNMT